MTLNANVLASRRMHAGKNACECMHMLAHSWHLYATGVNAIICKKKCGMRLNECVANASKMHANALEMGAANSACKQNARECAGIH